MSIISFMVGTCEKNRLNDELEEWWHSVIEHANLEVTSWTINAVWFDDTNRCNIICQMHTIRRRICYHNYPKRTTRSAWTSTGIQLLHWFRVQPRRTISIIYHPILLGMRSILNPTTAHHMQSSFLSIYLSRPNCEQGFGICFTTELLSNFLLGEFTHVF
jgi:hypothetical protein